MDVKHRGSGGWREDVHPHFGAEYPQFGAQHPVLLWRGTQSPGAVPRRAPRHSPDAEADSWSRGAVTPCGFWGAGVAAGTWLCACPQPPQPRGARQSLERSPSIIPSSGALWLGRGLQLQRAPGLEASPRSAAPAEPRCHPGARSGDRSARTRPLRGPGLN